MSPSFIFCAVYIISIGSALINYTRWGLKDYSAEAFDILLSGAVIFILVGFIVKKIIFNRAPNNYEQVVISSRINENTIVSILLVIINIIILILTIRQVKAIGGNGSWGEMMENFRSITSYSLDPTMSIPGYLQQLQKIPTVCAYIYPFILIHNITNNTVRKKDYFLCIINIMIFIAMSLDLSNRLNILGIVGALILYYFVLHQGSSNSNGLQIVFRLLLIFIGLMIIFYLIRLMVGRLGSTDTDFVDYITLYIGGPVKLFDLFLKNPIHDFSIWGKETFVSLIGTMRDLGANIPVYLMHKEFRTFNGIELGNVYSAYRDWYADFGLAGTLILQAVFSFFYNCYYYELQKKGINKHKISFIIYAYLSNALFLHPIEDWFFNMCLSVGTLIYIVIFIVLYQIITKRIKI